MSLNTTIKSHKIFSEKNDPTTALQSHSLQCMRACSATAVLSAVALFENYRYYFTR